MTARTLPRWHPSMSDGCSIVNSRNPAWLRRLITIPEGCCIEHDRVYYYGGSRVDRLRADRRFALCLLRQGLGFVQVELIYRSVRWWGRPSCRVSGVSWAFGEGRFRYDSQPAVPQ